MHRVTLALALVASLALVGDRVSAAQSVPLELTVTLDRAAYEPGQPLGFTLRVRNTSRAPVTVTFATSQRFDLVLRSEVIEIDRWSRGRVAAQVVGEQRWAPGETVTYSGTWLPVSTVVPRSLGEPAEQPLARGVYSLEAELTGVGVRLTGDPAIVIVGAPTALPTGCTNLDAPFPVELPASVVARTVEPADALHSLWQRQLPVLEVYAAYNPTLTIFSDLKTVNTRFPLTICMTAPGRILLP